MPVIAPAQAKAYLAQAGFTGNDLNIATAIAGAESSYNTTATHVNSNGSTDYGLMQINSVHNPSDAAKTDPLANAQAAYAVYAAAGHSFTPWATFTSGAYEKYMTSATNAQNAGLSVPFPGTGIPIPLPDPGTVASAASAASAIGNIPDAINKAFSNLIGVMVGVAFIILGILILARRPLGRAVKSGADVAKLAAL